LKISGSYKNYNSLAFKDAPYELCIYYRRNVRDNVGGDGMPKILLVCDFCAAASQKTA
jgi:hypothetical protein